jgi:hypothetical protein
VTAALVTDDSDHGRSLTEALGTGSQARSGENAGVQILDKPTEA